MTEKYLVFNPPDLGDEEMSAVMDVMKSGWIGTGKVAHKFEEEFSKFYGGRHAIAVSSCSIGLELALKSLRIGEGDEVITTPVTFAATLNAILNAGARPVLVDVDENGCMDINMVNRNISLRTKAFMPVHLSGTPLNVGQFRMSVPIIEDCAHSFGNRFNSRGCFQVFSFYANKNITCGEGGMVLTGDKDLAERVRVISSQGLSKGSWRRYTPAVPQHYSVEEVGLKGNLPDILAAIGLIQLRRWPEMKEKRDVVFNIYEEAFGKMSEGHSTHFYPLKVKNRDQMKLKLHEQGIGTGIHYKPLHLEPAYQFLGYKKGDFPEAERWGNEELSLPVSSVMSESDAIRVVESVQKIKGEKNEIRVGA